MKRFVSLLLVAMLVVSSFATVGFAAGTGKITGKDVTAAPGQTVDVKVTVSGEFANFEMFVKVEAPLSIESISGGGVVANPATGKVVWAAAENTDKVTFTVKIKVADSAEYGKTYPVKLSNKFVSDATLTDLDVSVSNGSVTIVCSEHAWTGWTVIEEPTCTETGKKTRTCTKCGEVETAKIDAKGHDYTWKTIEEPTCTKDGKEEGTCKVCGDKTTRKIEALGHKYDENAWVVTMAPTCTEPGVESIVCERCGEVVKTREIAAAGHSFDDEIWMYDETHHWHVCTVCGAKCEHNAEHGPITEWQIVKEPTVNETGLQQKFCEVCGAVVASEEIPADQPIDPGPGKTGDPTGTLMMIGGMSMLLLILLAVSLYMIKRKASAK